MTSLNREKIIKIWLFFRVSSKKEKEKFMLMEKVD